MRGVRPRLAPNRATVAGMDTNTKAIATLLRYADKHHAPASFVAMLWRLRAESSTVQEDRLHQLYAAMHEGHRAAMARTE